ncbi:MAG: F0F1 ATP synthase subunit B [Bacteroidia bacterium]|nr:F0F1 ATP synthase subunit B [Bacteroidia bacterium]
MGSALIQPQVGLFFWSAVIFLVFFFILRRFAWKPILNAISAREAQIEESLQKAEQARKEMADLQSSNEALLREARAERDEIIRQANDMKDKIVKDARDEAANAAALERQKAMQQIEAEKRAAIDEIKNTASALAVDVAEKVLRKEFESKSTQEEFAKKVIADLGQN